MKTPLGHPEPARTAPSHRGNGMALDPDILLGRLAVGKKLLSQEQVRAALRAQAAETPRRPLGDVLVSEGLLSPEQVEGLLSLQAAYLAKERRTAGGPRRLEDVIFGKILVKHGLAPEEAVNRALAAQAESEESGSGGSRRLGEILVEEGTVAPDVVSKVLEFQEKKILACTGCGAQWNVANYDPDRDYRCRTCQGPLAIPALLKDVGVAGTLTLGRGTPQDDLTPATIGAEGLPSGVTIEEFEGAGRTRVDRGTLATRTGGGPRAGAEGGDEDATGALEGRSVGGCKILKKLGQGGMGAVYLAEHVGLDKKVAIKVIRSVAGTPASLVQRFLREAKSAAKLAHPNVVQVFNVGEDRGFHFIEMEFVEGRSVRDLIAEEKLDLEETIRILRECLKGLGEAHRQGLIHRDVKPDNILVARTGQVKIVDFGLARAVEGGEGDDITRSGQILGTPHFMSPEQCDGQKTDQRTDIYSLGATVYNMLTGEKPFVGETAMAILMKHINEDAAPIREKAPDV
ncbi:MAG: protein kinase, partial [Planctomycetales bacterium]|nr:protein kinase [Planctomycetales bacterium]